MITKNLVKMESFNCLSLVSETKVDMLTEKN